MHYQKKSPYNPSTKIIVEKFLDTPNRIILNVLPHESFLETVNMVKNLPQRRYHGSKKKWSVPFDQKIIDELMHAFRSSISFSFNWEYELSHLKENAKKKNKKNNPQGSPFTTNQSAENKKFSSAGNSESALTEKERNPLKLGNNFGKVVLKKDSKYRIKAFVNPQQKTVVQLIKTIPGRAWNFTEKYWSLPYVKETFEILEQVETDCQFKIRANIPAELNATPQKTTEKVWKEHIPPSLGLPQQNALNELEDRLNLERKGWRTIKSYSNHLLGLLRYYANVDPIAISPIQIQKYILFKVVKHQIAESTQNQLINALKAYFERALGQADKVIYIPRPKKSKSLPNVFSKSEVKDLLDSINNIKHKAMIAIIYSAGLRKGELLKLRVKDILYSRNCIFVKSAKGKKDRYVTLSKNAAKIIKQYRQMYKPRYWLFEGQTGGNYSESALQSIFTTAKDKSNVNSYVTLHGLRHSYATHLFESGIPLNAIKDLLGHNSLKTTEIYMHISNKYLQQVQSPLDSIDLF